jgi:hypothetical protein
LQVRQGTGLDQNLRLLVADAYVADIHRADFLSHCCYLVVNVSEHCSRVLDGSRRGWVIIEYLQRMIV